MKNILKDDKLFYTFIGMTLIIPVILGIVYVFSVIYI